MKRDVRRMNRWTSVILSVMFIVLLSAGLSAEIPAEVVKAAQEGLTQVTRGTLPGNVVNNADWKDARIDFGFRVYTIKAERLVNDRVSQLHGMITPMDVYRFVVKSNGSPLALLTVGKLEGKWMMVSIGAAGLSEEINTVSNSWSNTRGYEFRFVRIFEAKADFVEISKGTEPLGFVPCAAARVAMQLGSSELVPQKLYYNSELIETLRDMVSERMSSKDDQDIFNQEG